MNCGNFILGNCGLSSSVDKTNLNCHKCRNANCGTIIIHGCGTNSCGSRKFSTTILDNNSKRTTIKTVFVCDIDLHKQVANCVVDSYINGHHNYIRKDISFDTLRKEKMKYKDGCNEIKGLHIKKDNTLKIKPKELVPYIDILTEKYDGFEKSFKHMKKLKQFLKEIKVAEKEINNIQINLDSSSKRTDYVSWKVSPSNTTDSSLKTTIQDER
jgi:hypothetical protein